jgi:glycosyltransferase involved in cell wall biosynthesis
MELMHKLKIVWICHFSNKEVREHLPLASQKLKNSVKNVLGKKIENSYRDFAPWITNLIKEFKNFKEVELHIIAPHVGLKAKTTEFTIDGIHYHFFKSDDISILGKIKKKLTRKEDTNYESNRKLVYEFIKEIQPNIINLIGTENPYYSITALDIKNIPVYVSAQTVYTNPLRKIHSFVNQDRWDLELKIHQKEIYFGCGGRMHRDLILNNNPDAIIFKMFFPLEKPTSVKEVPKEFDFVFFAAGVNNKKGVEDAIDAFALVKKQNPTTTLNIVGGCRSDYKLVLEKKIKNLNLEQNIIFNGYFAVHADMHQHIKKSRFAVLPNKLDIISGTVLEAILL